MLKSTPHASAREARATADVTRRRLVVDAIQDADIPKVRGLIGGVTTDVEWFFTAREIEAALEKTCDLDALSIAPGPLARRDWARIAYKGGSEQGVLNLSAHLTSKTGRRHCIVATWNDVKPLDETVLVASFSVMADRLAREER